MWFECCGCEMILPLYEVATDSAKYAPMEDWVCQECAYDAMLEHAEYPEEIWTDKDEEREIEDELIREAKE